MARHGGDNKTKARGAVAKTKGSWRGTAKTGKFKIKAQTLIFTFTYLDSDFGFYETISEGLEMPLKKED